MNNTSYAFPRSRIADCAQFTPWYLAQDLIRSMEHETVWLLRSEAEKSECFVQPIPCALVLGDNGYHVFRRINQDRSDLSKRFSLMVGGHIDQGAADSRFSELAVETLTREIEEELKTETSPVVANLIGIVIDFASLESSRHVAIVYEAMASGRVKPKAIEEFSMRSEYGGRLCTPSELSELYKKFDPWSMLIFDDYINPSYSQNVAKQLDFFSLLNEPAD